MPAEMLDTSALEQTLALYGDVLRATMTFENQASAFLAGLVEKQRERFEAAGLEFAARVEHREPYAWAGARICSAAYRISMLGRLPRPTKAYLIFNLNWLLAPGHDRKAPPYAYLEIHYGDLGDLRGAWKSKMASVRDELPAGIYTDLYKSYFGLMRPPKDDGTYRVSLADVAADFDFLGGSFAKALSASLSKGRR